MEHFISYDALSAALNYIRSNARNICLCSDAPLTYSQAVGDYMIAMRSISSSFFEGPEEYIGEGEQVDEGPGAILHVLPREVQASVTGWINFVALVTDQDLLVVCPCESRECEDYGTKFETSEWCIRLKQPIADCFENGGGGGGEES